MDTSHATCTDGLLELRGWELPLRHWWKAAEIKV